MHGAFLALLFVSASHAADPRASMRQGEREFGEERYQEAAEAFRAAAEQAGEARLDPARALYNYANTLYQQGQYEAAAESYREALRSTDLDLQQSAHFNRGNALLTHAQQLAEAQQLDLAKAMTQQSLDSYRNALLLNAADRDAKINYELADRFREQLEMMLAQQPAQPEPEQGEDEEEGGQQPQPQPEEQPQPDEGEEEQDPSLSPDETQREPDHAPRPEPPEESMEEMTEEEAMLLLDALRDEEQETRDHMRLQLGQPAEVEKDW